MTRPTFAGPSPFFFVIVLALGMFGCGDDDICDSVSVVRELRTARAGQTVRLGACRIEDASVEVPEGVTLEGRDGTELVGNGMAPVVTLAEGAALANVRVETRGSVGVNAPNADTTLRNVTVSVLRGIGVGIEGAGSELIGVTIVGPDDADTFPPFAEPDEGAYGFVVLDAGDVSLVDVRVEKVGPWGGIVAGTTLTWNGGSVTEVVGTGLYADGGAVDLTNVRFDGFEPGLQPLPAYGAVFTNGVMATSMNVEVANGDLGVLHDASPGTHTGLNVHDNTYGGVWIQRSDDVALAGGTFTGNGVTAVASVLSSNIQIDGSALESSVSQLTVFGEIAAIETGDGVQVLEPMGTHTLRALTVSDHPRIGVLIDLGASGVLADVGLTDVSVEGDGLGCLAQDAMDLVPLGGWDDDVTRLGATAANDPAQLDILALGGSLSEGNLPAIDTGALGL